MATEKRIVLFIGARRSQRRIVINRWAEGHLRLQKKLVVMQAGTIDDVREQLQIIDPDIIVLCRSWGMIRGISLLLASEQADGACIVDEWNHPIDVAPPVSGASYGMCSE